tara:strand:- start:10 stop:1053 length:1044 start_codon:yes stop_codon:yes gene_type:complete
MEIFFTMIVFCIVLFIYIHVFFHFKTSNDLEVYDIDVPSKEKLEELCDLRQPITMKLNLNDILNTFNRHNIAKNYGAFDINIRNSEKLLNDEEKFVVLTYNTGIQLFNEKNEKNSYYSENNKQFLEETSLIKTLQNNDALLRPYMVSSCNYDIMNASEETTTVLKYDVSYRNYLYVTEGEITIKLTPPHNSKYLFKENDYEMFEFRSVINPWKIQEKYKHNFEKVKFLELTIQRGSIIYIPAYWWYSFKFGKDTTVVAFNYKTYMNIISLTPQLGIHYLQTLNIKFKTENVLTNFTKKETLSGNISNDNQSPQQAPQQAIIDLEDINKINNLNNEINEIKSIDISNN